MGAGGEDVQLSPLARSLFNYTVECKNRAAIAVYKDYEQAKTHGLVEPLVILKQNNSKPLALVDADHFFDLVVKIEELKNQVDALLFIKGKQ
jgi:alpha/beta superfamily hydrolase